MDQEQMKMIYEFFDLQDEDTRKALISIDESQRDGILNSLALKFYNDIMNRIDDIDFGTIPDSKGNIRNVENFEEMLECLNTLSKILVEYKQPRTQIDEIEEAINHMIDNTKLFEKAFKLKADLPVVIYCTVVFAIVSSVSLMMTSCIEFIKNPAYENFTIEFKKAGYAKTQNSMMYQNILKFNKSARKGELTKCLTELVQGAVAKAVSEDAELMNDMAIDEGFFSNLKSVGAAFAKGAGINNIKNAPDYVNIIDPSKASEGIKSGFSKAKDLLRSAPKAVWIPIVSIIGLIGLIWLIRAMIFGIYHARVKASDYFEAQANIMQMNAYAIKDSDINKTPEQKDEIIKKQMSIADRFRSLANFFAIKNREAEVKTQKELSNEKYTAATLFSGGDSLF